MAMGPGSHECPRPFQSQSPPQQAAGAAGAKLRDPRTQAAQGPSLARRDHPHRCRPAQGKPPCSTSVGHLALRHSGGTSPPGRKSQAVTSWPSAPGGAVPSLGSKTRVPAPHHRSTRSGPSQLRTSTNTTTAPAAATRGRHAPASSSEAVYPSLGQRLGTGSVSRPLQTWRGRGGSERGHRAPERRRAGASSPARLTTRDRTPLGTQGCCPPWASAQPRGRLPSTAQQVLPCAATGKPGSRSPAEARPAPRNARGTLLQGVTTRGGEWGARDPCSRSRAHQQELSDAGNGGPRAE